MRDSDTTTRQGLAYGLAAYGLWGIVPLYFWAVAAVPPLEILAHRIVWSVGILVGLILLGRRGRELLRSLRSRPVVAGLLGSSILIAVNWFVYIYGVATAQVLQTSLGYFVNPLVNVLLGMLVFRERLRGLQWLAVSLAAVGVVNLAVAAGSWPWIALTLALSFGFYGLLRKVVPVDGLVGLTVETALLLPLAVTYLLWRAGENGLVWGRVDRTLDGLIAFSGLVTTVPLLCFAQAARRLPLSTLGFLQYLAPSLQFLLAITVFQEPIGREKLASFACIWTALGLYTVDSIRVYRQWRVTREALAVPPTVAGEPEPDPVVRKRNASLPGEGSCS